MKLTNNYQFNVSTNTWQVSIIILGVPVPVGLYAYSFLLRLYHFSSVSPHVENCMWLLLAAKRLSLQSLTQRQKCTSLYIFDCEFCLTSKHRVCLIPRTSLSVLNWLPCQNLHASFFAKQKTSLLLRTDGIHAAFENPRRIKTAKDGSGFKRNRVRTANSQTKNVHGCSFFVVPAGVFLCAPSICTIYFKRLTEGLSSSLSSVRNFA